MKQTTIITLATGLLLITLMVAQGSSQNIDNKDTAEKYANLIDATIAKCQNKLALLDSRSENIRRQAIRACLKGAYLRVNKKELVSYLVALNAEPTQHRVEYFLNNRFYQSMKPDGMVVLLEASQMMNRSR